MQWRGGSCSFPWVEDYRSLRRFCVLAARRALLGLLGTALVGLVHFAEVQTTVSLYLCRVWAWGTWRVNESSPPPHPPLPFVVVGREVESLYRIKFILNSLFIEFDLAWKRPLQRVQLFHNTVFPTPTSRGKWQRVAIFGLI